MQILERPSPNFGSRKGSPITCLVIHDSISRTAESVLSWFSTPMSRVSSHYVIDTDGTVYRCVPDDKAAWHAGGSELYSVPNVNAYSLGIELVSMGEALYPPEQIQALDDLIVDLCHWYKIPLNRVVGHKHIAKPLGRKSDPHQLDFFELLIRVGARLVKSLAS